MEITSFLVLPHSNLASLQLELLAVPQVLLALRGSPFSTLRVKPNLSKEHTKTSVMWTLTPSPVHIISCLLPLLPLSILAHSSFVLYKYWASSRALGHTFTYDVPFARILGVGIHRLYTELAFINHYVSDTSYELTSNNICIVLFHVYNNLRRLVH